MNIITKNRNKNKPNYKKNGSKEESLEISGLTEAAGQGHRNIEFSDDETDIPLTDQLYNKPKHRPLDGSGAVAY